MYKYNIYPRPFRHPVCLFTNCNDNMPPRVYHIPTCLLCSLYAYNVWITPASSSSKLVANCTPGLYSLLKYVSSSNIQTSCYQPRARILIGSTSRAHTGYGLEARLLLLPGTVFLPLLLRSFHSTSNPPLDHTCFWLYLLFRRIVLQIADISTGFLRIPCMPALCPGIRSLLMPPGVY